MPKRGWYVADLLDGVGRRIDGNPVPNVEGVFDEQENNTCLSHEHTIGELKLIIAYSSRPRTEYRQ